MTRLTTTRRAVLAGLGTGITAGLTGADALARQTGTGYALVQGDACAPIRPLRGRESVRAFYDYRLPQRYVSDANGGFGGEAVPYSSVGTTALQRAQTSIAFLYRGPGGLSLVFVHGSVDDTSPGSVTFRIAGLPEGGDWIVRDDYYLDPETGEPHETNYDRWAVEGSAHRIDWTWDRDRTDGGVFGYLGDEFDVYVEPGFNEAAALFGRHYQGRLTDWEFLTITANGLTRLSLALDEPIRVVTGHCVDASGPGPTGPPPDLPTRPGRDEEEDGQGKDDDPGPDDDDGDEETGRPTEDEPDEGDGGAEEDDRGPWRDEEEGDDNWDDEDDWRPGNDEWGPGNDDWVPGEDANDDEGGDDDDEREKDEEGDDDDEGGDDD